MFPYRFNLFPSRQPGGGTSFTSCTLRTTEQRRLNSPDWKSRLARPGRAAADIPKRVMAGGTTAILFLDVAFASVPTSDLHHRLFVKLDAEQPTEMSLLTAIVSLRSSAPLVLSPPVKGEYWLAMNGLSNDSSHRRTIVVVDGRATIAQRFATDWTRLGSDGQAFHDDPAQNSNWYAYGVDVLSVHRGRVTGAQDGITENNPTADHKAVPIDLNTVAGNYLIVQIAPYRYALYAHLQPGSFKVRVGDRVKAGDLLARLGNSGNSDAPHLDFHVCDRNSPLGCEGIPYVFDCFSQFGEVPSLEVLTNGVGWKPIENGSPKLRKHELPTSNAVVRFQ